LEFKVDVVKLEVVENKIVEIRGQKVLLDSDVAELYGVETRDICPDESPAEE
jgi:hypothetical protein